LFERGHQIYDWGKFLGLLDFGDRSAFKLGLDELL